MNERIKELRKTLNLTMDKFGARVGVSKSAISNIENGNRNVTDQMFKFITSEFNVNEDWLKTGNGKMFVETKEDYIADLSKRYNLDELDIKIVESYLALDDDSRQVIKDYIHNLADSIEKTAEEIEEAKTKAEIDAEVESYRRELELEKRAAGKSSVLQESGESGETKIKNIK